MGNDIQTLTQYSLTNACYWDIYPYIDASISSRWSRNDILHKRYERREAVIREEIIREEVIREEIIREEVIREEVIRDEKRLYEKI